MSKHNYNDLHGNETTEMRHQSLGITEKTINDNIL